MGLSLGLGIGIGGNGVSAFSPAKAYIKNVITAGSSFTPAQEAAVIAFINGLIANGIWPKIKFANLMYGFTGLGGCFVDLKGAHTPINNNFVSGDYSPTAGLTGSGATGNKYIDTGAEITELVGSETNNHMGFWQPSAATGSGYVSGVSAAAFFLLDLQLGTIYNANFNSAANQTNQTTTDLFIMSRDNSSDYKVYNGAETTIVQTQSTSLSAENMLIFASNLNGTPIVPIAGTLRYFTIGENLSSSEIATYNSLTQTLMAAL